MAFKITFTVLSVAICMISYISENAYVEATECSTSLKNFGYTGEMHIDTETFEVKSHKEIKYVVGYRDYTDFMDDIVFSAANNIVENYCNIVVPLMKVGFSGYLKHDSEHSPTDNGVADLAGQYKEYVSKKLAKIPKDDKGNQNTFVFEVVYEYAVTQLGQTKEGKKCKEENTAAGANGNFLNDLLAVGKKEKHGIDNVDDYKAFLKHAKIYVLFTHRNALNVFCDLVDALHDAKYTGDLARDIATDPEDKALKEEYAMYKIYLKKVVVQQYVDAGVPAPTNFLHQFGVSKLGEMQY